MAKEWLEKLNPHINYIAQKVRITPENVLEKLEPFDLIVDGSDNFQTRYLINDAALLLDVPLVYGSIYRFEGQVTVFNYVGKGKKRGPDLRDLYPDPPDTGFIPDCSTTGDLGVLPGVIGSIQATEVIKILCGIGDVLSGKLLVMDLLNMDNEMISFSKPDKGRKINRQKVKERLKNYWSDIPGIQEISASELSSLINSPEEISLIDVRTLEEHKRFSIGGTLIPLGEIESRSDEIDTDTKTVIYCQSGQRSAEAIRKLWEFVDGNHLYNLDGGVEAWRELFEVEGKVRTYMLPLITNHTNTLINIESAF